MPEGVVWEGKGAHYADLTPLGRRDQLAAAVAIPSSLEEGYLCLGTQQGSIKRVALADLPGVGGEPFVVMGDHVFLGSICGMASRIRTPWAGRRSQQVRTR